MRALAVPPSFPAEIPPPETPGKWKGVTQTRAACEALREKIIAGLLAPGAKLNIALLALELQVSNGAVREALAMLEADALVVSEPQRGFRVSLISITDLMHLTQARVEIEKLCLADAMQFGGVEWESAMVGALHRLSRHSEPDDAATAGPSREWMDAHAEFHRALASGCRNAWLLGMRETLYRQSERYRQFSDRSSPPQRDVGGEHRALVEALLAHDRERVNQLVADHLSRTAERVVAGLKGREASITTDPPKK